MCLYDVFFKTTVQILKTKIFPTNTFLLLKHCSVFASNVSTAAAPIFTSFFGKKFHFGPNLPFDLKKPYKHIFF